MVPDKSNRVEDFLRRLVKDKIRFAVRNSEGGHSAVWSAIANGSDYYIAARSFMGFHKISRLPSRINGTPQEAPLGTTAPSAGCFSKVATLRNAGHRSGACCLGDLPF
jgi:hypothetical protein